MTTRITFIIDGNPRVTHNWSTVPRVDEHIRFDADPKLAVVVDVIYWNYDGDCRADVICEYPAQ